MEVFFKLRDGVGQELDRVRLGVGFKTDASDKISDKTVHKFWKEMIKTMIDGVNAKEKEIISKFLKLSGGKNEHSNNKGR